MSAYDFQVATADRIAEIFREATVAADGTSKESRGQRRVLLADEVGLGKTHVAAEVIDRVRKMRNEVDDKMYRVIYVCSNMSIAHQNIQKLGINNMADVSESRLSMQHLTIREREAKICTPESDKMGEIIIPITPSTSFTLAGSSMGNAKERALIAQILVRLDEFKAYKSQIHYLFRGKASNEGWSYSLRCYDMRINRLVNKSGNSYIEDINGYLEKNEDFIRIKNNLIAYFDGVLDKLDIKTIINRLRRIFADVSLSMLEPDLIIMDEFQRFSSLLDYSDDSEQTAIVKKFFEQEGGQQPLILLLSATPYKPYTTLEELTEYNADAHYEDFNRLTDFLFNGNQQFKEIWSDYSHNLSHISGENFNVLIASKRSAEEKMYEAICRTERLRQSLLIEKKMELLIDENDILSFAEMQRIVESCKNAASRSVKHCFKWSKMPVEYVKSSPYLLSFMDSYVLKQHIERIYARGFKGLYAPTGITLLKQAEIENFRRLPMCNARLKYLHDVMFPDKCDAELLLWVPASNPYYTTYDSNPFVKNRDFSKVLIFSAWEMVPRMIAVMMSYEAERKAIYSKHMKTRYKATTGSERLKPEAKEILSFPSKYLSTIYLPKKYFGQEIDAIKSIIKLKIENRLSDIPKSNRSSNSKILAALRWLDDVELPKPDVLPSNIVDILTDMAIAAPGVCLLRILTKPAEQQNADEEQNVDESQIAGIAKNAADGFVSLFNRRMAAAIIDKIQKRRRSNKSYLEGVLEYCVIGNLQAVLDEYAHLCGDTFVQNLTEAFIKEANYKIDTDQSFGVRGEMKYTMNALYAVPFSKKKSASNDDSQTRTNNVRCAFQSPFYPFIVASTSVGQEGLDFHWYCRKIMHWNLPSNPQDLEQREGRINRYKCLAIRRNLASLIPGIYDWNEIFKKAGNLVREQVGDKYSQMVPYWCLPEEWIEKNGNSLERIERIVPQYPMSIDIERYRHLVEVLSLYRLTMGQPRQEELLELLGSKQLSERQISQLLFNLSPINRRKGVSINSTTPCKSNI